MEKYFTIYNGIAQRSQTVRCTPREGGALLVLWWRATQIVYMKDTFILNEIWAQDKIYILVSTLLGLNKILLYSIT
jgi:hypothetical protein